MQQLTNPEFWSALTDSLRSWVVLDLPAVAAIVLVFIVVLRITAVSFKRLQRLMLARAERSPDIDSDEAFKRITTLVGIARSSIRILLWFTFGMILLQRVGINIAPILASAGIIGLAVGFGAQELVRDVITGFFILLENQIRTGDVAVLNGTGGVVESIALRTTTLRDLSGTVHVIQNGKISSLSNMTKEWSAIVLDIGVAYKENTSHVARVMQQVGDNLQADNAWGDKIIAPVEVLGVESFDDSAVVIRARIKTRPIQQWAVGREYRRRLKEAFDAANIEIPFPHRTVFLPKGEDRDDNN